VSLLSWISGSNPTAIMAEAGQKAVGSIFDGVANIISQFHLSPEDRVKFELSMAQLKLETLKAQTADVASARTMQMTSPSVWPGILSTAVVGGYFWALWYLLTTGLPGVDAPGGEVLIMLFQTLNVAVGMVLQFWLGSSYGSQQKTDYIYRSTPPK
jgi:nitrate reductase NapE component